MPDLAEKAIFMVTNKPISLACAANSMKAAQRSRRRSEMLRHMEEQRRAGGRVPGYAFDELRADMAKDGDVIKQ
jgi:hypothetical protein